MMYIHSAIQIGTMKQIINTAYITASSSITSKDSVTLNASMSTDPNTPGETEGKNNNTYLDLLNYDEY